MSDPLAGFDLQAWVVERAAQAGLRIDPSATAAIATHAHAVFEHNDRLRLTTVTEPREFLERHIGESLEGAALLDKKARGRLVDLGSGNGYPAIPIAAIHPGLDLVCTEASQAKAAFLADTLIRSETRGAVWNRQIQRPEDFADTTPIRVLSSRAMGNWERIFPRVSRLLAKNGVALLWAGESVTGIAGRESWRRLNLVARHALPGRRHSWIWCFRAKG